MIINSILDTDWYKITMAQVVHFYFRDAFAHYKFYDRNGTIYPKGFAKILRGEIDALSELELSPRELAWLEASPSIYPKFLEWFKTYRFLSREVFVAQDPEGHLLLEIRAPWQRAIFWEVPLLALVSELYFRDCAPSNAWQQVIQIKHALMNFPFADFGTRRRFSFAVQDYLVQEFSRELPAMRSFLGTSNPALALKHNVPVVGTYAHEAVMAMVPLFGLAQANLTWLNHWRSLYGKQMNTALGDTFTTKYFLKTMPDIAFQLLDGIRQDSGDPFEVGRLILKKWQELGINPKTKTIVFSDGLRPDKAEELYNEFSKFTNPIFGIGTNLTNDCGHTPLNIVIKLDSINGNPASEYFVRGRLVASFSRARGWFYPKHARKRDNPVSLLRDLLMQAGKYPKRGEARAGWDRTLGELYLYAEGKVNGVFVDRRIKLTNRRSRCLN